MLYVGAAGTATPMPSPWAWRTYTKDQIAEMQQNDPDIKEILDLREQHAVRPIYEEIARKRPEVKNYWAQWHQLVMEDGILYRGPKTAARL